MHCLTTILRKQIVAMFLSLFLVSGGSVWAQFDGQYSQYMNNLCLINPSYSGSQPMIQASLFERLQWIGMPGAPVVSMLSVDAPFKLMGTEHGAGIQFVSDVFGVFNNQQVRLLYSYKYDPAVPDALVSEPISVCSI